MLYAVLKQLVKGSKGIILESCAWPSYIQGMCLLTKHCEINKNNRIDQAFHGVDTLELKDEAQVWATTAITRVQELLASRAEMAHYILKSLKNSLEGKCKSVQIEIAKDMSALDPEDEVNIYDFIQTYATMLSSAGYTGSNEVLAMEEDTEYSDNLSGKGGEEKWKQKQLEKKAARAERMKKKCTFCGTRGHEEHECRNKEAAAKALILQENTSSQTGQQITQPTSNETATTQHALAAYLTDLRKGLIPTQRLITVDTSRDTAYGMRGDAHIGEASHPGPKRIVKPKRARDRHVNQQPSAEHISDKHS